ncbi:hypothetical protein BKA70DRAFT_1395812 [Coprinopsis sp. MPI-PUGE-AT-0042]|nr:hypothetical protein BKA70DRAFT_1395812 [Coprinopsis sp. MPI-PUGE-AT-0042]
MVGLKTTKLTEQFLIGKNVVWLKRKATEMNVAYSNDVEVGDLVELILKAQPKTSKSPRRSGTRSESTSPGYPSISQTSKGKGKGKGKRRAIKSGSQNQTTISPTPATQATSPRVVTDSPPDELIGLMPQIPLAADDVTDSPEPEAEDLMPQMPIEGRARRTLANMHDVPRKPYRRPPVLKNTIGTPETSPDSTPEPPTVAINDAASEASESRSASPDPATIEEIKRTYDIILELAKENDALDARLDEMEALVTKLETAVPDVQEGVRMNEADGVRQEAYAMEWHNIRTRTSWETLWSTERNGYLLYRKNIPREEQYEINSDDADTPDGERIKDLLDLDEVEREHDSEIGEVEIGEVDKYWDELPEEPNRGEGVAASPEPVAEERSQPRPARELSSRKSESTQAGTGQASKSPVAGPSPTRRITRISKSAAQQPSPSEARPTSQKRKRKTEPDVEEDVSETVPSDEARYQPRRKLRTRAPRA